MRDPHKSLTVRAIDDKTGLPKNYCWESGMKSIKEKK
ncbi:cytidine deaminase-like fold-containing protein [Pseudomonas pergaminensis]